MPDTVVVFVVLDATASPPHSVPDAVVVLSSSSSSSSFVSSGSISCGADTETYFVVVVVVLVVVSVILVVVVAVFGFVAFGTVIGPFSSSSSTSLSSFFSSISFASLYRCSSCHNKTSWPLVVVFVIDIALVVHVQTCSIPLIVRITHFRGEEEKEKQ